MTVDFRDDACVFTYNSALLVLTAYITSLPSRLRSSLSFVKKLGL